MSVLNPQTLMFNGAPVSNANPLPCSSASATQAAISTAMLNPVTWLLNGDLVSITNPIPIVLADPPDPPASWSATNKSAHIILSNNDLTATNDGAFAQPTSGRSDSVISGSAKIFWVATIDVSVAGATDAIGVANSSWTFTDNTYMGGDTFSLGYYDDGRVFVNFATLATIAPYTTGAPIGIAMNRGTDKIWFTLDGSTWNNDVIANQNPAMGAGGIITGITGDLFPSYQTFESGGVGSQWTANFNGSPYPIPSGFTKL